MKNMKKGLAGILVAILLVIGYFTGVIPTDGDNAEMDISSVISQTITDEADDKATDVPTEAPTEKPTKAPTAKPTKAPTATPTAKPTKAPTKAPTEAPTEAPRKKAGPITEPQDIVDYLYEHGELPDNFITKKEAQNMGWDSSWNYVSDVAPGKSIGGDRFGNYEGLLPDAPGRKWTECDIDTLGKSSRGAKRIVFSNDGLIYYTDDHYESFELLYGEP